eukprot:8442350-Alexandrium_andersonii.AAC.1
MSFGARARGQGGAIGKSQTPPPSQNGLHEGFAAPAPAHGCLQPARGSAGLRNLAFGGSQQHSGPMQTRQRSEARRPKAHQTS